MQDFDRAFKELARRAGRRLDIVEIIGRQVMMESRICREMRQLGRMDAFRENVPVILEERFGSEAARSVSDALNALEDVELLSQLFHTAMRCASIEEFRRALKPPTPPRRRRSR